MSVTALKVFRTGGLASMPGFRPQVARRKAQTTQGLVHSLVDRVRIGNLKPVNALSMARESDSRQPKPNLFQSMLQVAQQHLKTGNRVKNSRIYSLVQLLKDEVAPRGQKSVDLALMEQWRKAGFSV